MRSHLDQPSPCHTIRAMATTAHSDLSAPTPKTGHEVGYAVVDVETTGLSPVSAHVIELAVVLLDAQARPERVWSTLVGAPGLADTGPTHLHGIRPQDLSGAPTIEALTDLLAHDLTGRVIVAHNVRFDLGFLAPVLAARGHLADVADVSQLPQVCTMGWARHFLPTPSRRLTTCCQVAGVELSQHHCALADARASAGLLRHYLAVALRRGEEVPWGSELARAQRLRVWRWDAQAAQAQAGRLSPRAVGPVEPGSTGPTEAGCSL